MGTQRGRSLLRSRPMKMAVLGAGGGLGRNVVDAALRERHSVTALVRDARRAQLPDAVHLVVGDASHAPDLNAAMEGTDATLARRARAEARSATVVLRKTQLGDERDLSPARGLEGMILAAELTRAAWSMASHPPPPASPREVVVLKGNPLGPLDYRRCLE